MGILRKASFLGIIRIRMKMRIKIRIRMRMGMMRGIMIIL